MPRIKHHIHRVTRRLPRNVISPEILFAIAGVVGIFLCISGIVFLIMHHRPPANRYDKHIYSQLSGPNAFSELLMPLVIIFSQNQIIHYSLGLEEQVPMGDLRYVPDGHISFVRDLNGILSVFITALNKSYVFQGKTFSDIHLPIDQHAPQPVLGPSGDGFESSYSGFGSVFADTDFSSLIGIYHAEKRVNPDASDTQTAGIAVAISKDGGKSWQKKGKIINGLHELPIGLKTSGTGDPNAIIVGNYIYLYYVDWNDIYPTSIHLARAPLSSHGLPGSWQKYNNGIFTSKGNDSTPIILPPNINGQTSYIANPSISYNTYFKKYLGVFETNLGFVTALSEDGIAWHSFTQIFTFPKDTDIPKQIGDVWYSYPTFLSENTNTDMVTGQSGYLYYSRGIFGQYHTMVRRKLEFK